MDEIRIQQDQLVNDSSEQETNQINTTDNDQALVPPEIPVDFTVETTIRVFDHSTTSISEACREGDLEMIVEFKDYSLQTSMCGHHAAEIADRLDPETGFSPLHHAARYQQLDICLILLSNIPLVYGVNIKDANDRTPLHAAFLSLNRTKKKPIGTQQPFNIAEHLGDKVFDPNFLLEEYAKNILTADHPLIYLFSIFKGDIHAQDKYLLTPLHYAVARNNFPGVKQLIKLGANVEACDRQNVRPLHLACREGFKDIVEYLLSHHAEIEAFDQDLWTPLHYAFARGHLNIIELILEKDPEKFYGILQKKTNTSATCLHLAVQHGNLQSVEYLLNRLQLEDRDHFINEQAQPFGTPLHFATKFCTSSMIKLLLEHHGNPSIVNHENQTALHIAAISNRVSIVEELIHSIPASLFDIKDIQGRTALSVTTNLTLIDLLIRSGANISSLDNNRMNVLMIAVSKLEIEIVKYLLPIIALKNPSIFEQTDKKHNRSVFLLAVQTGSIDLCKLLMSQHAIKCDSVDKKRFNAFHLAARHDHHELITYLCEQNIKVDRSCSFRNRICSTDTNIIDFESNINRQNSMSFRSLIDGQNEDGKTALHIAAELGHEKSLEVLIKYGGNVLLPNSIGQLALHVAIQNGHSGVVEILLATCTKNLKDFQAALSRRQSPLIMACQHGYVDIVRLLLKENIFFANHFDEDDEEIFEIPGENPLIVAIEHRQTETVKLLLDHPQSVRWLMASRNESKLIHQTPLRDLIRFMPECAKHAFDRFISKTNESDTEGNEIQRYSFRYEFIDDYFSNKNEPYANFSHQLYRNHPFIIALDSEHHSLLEHPLAQKLLTRKWNLYRPIFYLNRTLNFVCVLFLTITSLCLRSPNLKMNREYPPQVSRNVLSVLQWIVVFLASVNIFKQVIEAILFRGLRVPLAQIFNFISSVTVIISFVPWKFESISDSFKWQMAAFSVLSQWLILAFVLRSVPFIGNFIVMFQSILINFFSLCFIGLPLFIGFAISNRMIFFSYAPFQQMTTSTHRLSTMILGEFAYQNLFHSTPTFIISIFIFISFTMIMAIVYMNLLLGLAIGDIHDCLENARAKAESYRIRELIYIESSLPSLVWLRCNVIKEETFVDNSKDLISPDNDEQQLTNRSDSITLKKSDFVRLDEILSFLRHKTGKIIQQRKGFEISLQKLLFVKNQERSTRSSSMLSK